MTHTSGTDLWANLPTLMQLVPFATLFSFATTLLDGQVIYLFMTDAIAPSGWVYTAILMALMMCLTSAAYVAVKTIEAAINWTHATIIEYAHKYKGGSVEWGNRLGLYELVAILMYLGYSIALSVMSLMGASMLWSAIDERQVGVHTEGKGGVALDEMEALKFVTMCMVVGVATLIGSCSLGDTADQLITWWDHYADDTKTEGDDKNTGVVDLNGTAAKHDMIYHWVTLFAGYTLFSMITFGGHMFAEQFMTFNDEVDCDFNMFDEATLDAARADLGAITSLEKCYEIIPGFMAKLDHNGNHWLDRCEDANNLVHLMGNTEAYARKYSHYVPHAAWKLRCDQLFNPLY